MEGLFTLASTALGGAIGFLSATQVASRNAHLAAGSKLRAAFAPELATLRSTPSEVVQPFKKILGPASQDVDTLLLKAFHERHAAAIEEYRFYVPARDQAAYEAAWQAYYLWGGSINFTAYMIGVGSHELYCERVEAIFRFTELTPMAARLRHWLRRR